MDAGFAWSVEEAKLLWAQGQQAVAVRMGKSLVDAAKGSRNSDVVAYARLLSLTGKWLAETRCTSLCSADALNTDKSLDHSLWHHQHPAALQLGALPC